MREESRLRVFEIRVLRRILVPKRHDVTREWRKLHNKKPNELYNTPNIKHDRIKNNYMCGTPSTYGERGGEYKVFGGET